MRGNIMILNERIVTIEEGFETYEVDIEDSDLKNFIDLKYDAEDIINIAKQLDKKVGDSDLDLAYSVILSNFDNADTDAKDITNLKQWIEDEIFDNFDIEELKEEEDTSAFDDNFDEADAPFEGEEE